MIHVSFIIQTCKDDTLEDVKWRISKAFDTANFEIPKLRELSPCSVKASATFKEFPAAYTFLSIASSIKGYSDLMRSISRVTEDVPFPVTVGEHNINIDGIDVCVMIDSDETFSVTNLRAYRRSNTLFERLCGGKWTMFTYGSKSKSLSVDQLTWNDIRNWLKDVIKKENVIAKIDNKETIKL